MNPTGSPQQPLHPWAEQYLNSLVQQNTRKNETLLPPSATVEKNAPSTPSSTSLLLKKLKCKTTVLTPSGRADSPALKEEPSPTSNEKTSQAQRKRVIAHDQHKMQERLLQSLFVFAEQQPHYLKQTLKRTTRAREADRESRDYSTRIAGTSSFYVSLALLPTTVIRRTLLFFVDHIHTGAKGRDSKIVDEESNAEEENLEETARLEMLLTSPSVRVEMAHFVVEVLASEKLQQKIRTPLWSLLARQHQQMQERFKALATESFLQETFNLSVEQCCAELFSLPKDVFFQEHPSKLSELLSSHVDHEKEPPMPLEQEEEPNEVERTASVRQSVRKATALPFVLYTCERGEHFQFCTSSPAMVTLLKQCQTARFQTLYTGRPQRGGAASEDKASLSNKKDNHFVPIVQMGRPTKRDTNTILEGDTHNASLAPETVAATVHSSAFVKALVPLLSETCQIRMCVSFLLELELLWSTARTLNGKFHLTATTSTAEGEEDVVELMTFLRRVFHLTQKRHIALLLSASHHSKRFQKKFAISEGATKESMTPVQYESVQALFQDFRAIMKREKNKEKKPILPTEQAFFYKVEEVHHKEEKQVQKLHDHQVEVTCTRANINVPWPFVLQFNTPRHKQQASTPLREQARIQFTLKPFKSYYSQLPQTPSAMPKKPFSDTEKQQLKHLQSLLQQQSTLVYLADGTDRPTSSLQALTRQHMRHIWKNKVQMRLFLKR